MKKWLTPLLLLTFLSQPIIAKAAEDSSNFFQPIELPDFWPPAQEIVQEQINLIPRIEQAFVSPDPNQVRLVRGQLLLHLFAVERLLKRYYQQPNFLCEPIIASGLNRLPPIGSLNSEQVQTYCTIYASTEKLASLRPIIDHRLTMLDQVAEVVEPLPLVTGEIRRDPISGIPTILRGDLSVPATPRLSPLPNIPTIEQPLIGRITKQPIANYVAPISPAIASPPQANTPLLIAKELLAQARQLFPRGTEFTEPNSVTLINESYPYSFDPADTLPSVLLPAYSQLLALPNTGIARIFPAEFYNLAPNKLRNRLIPADAQQLDFPPLFKPINNFTPRLPIQLADGSFQLSQRELDYGFMVDLGDLPLENIPQSVSESPTATPKFFFNYRPPNKLEALQIERRRFLTGKQQNIGLNEPIFTEAKAALNHTYLLRTIQFKLPEFIVTGEPINRRQRSILDILLETPSIDLVIAFRPIYQRLDGSYIVLWRIVKQFPDPKIQDLEKYVNLE